MESTNTQILCNTVNSSSNGIKFEGNCDATMFKGNTMVYDGVELSNGNEYNGLFLVNAIIGPQPDLNTSSELGGNMWINTDNWMIEVNGAKYIGTPDPLAIAASAFAVNSTSNPFNPVKIETPNDIEWFLFNSNINSSCPIIPESPESPTVTNGDVKKMVAEGKIEDFGYGIGKQWISSRKLYRQLYNDGLDMTYDVVVSDFYDDNLNSSIGLFEEIKTEINTIITLDEGIKIEMADIELLISPLLEDLEKVNQDLLVASETEVNDLIAQKINILYQLNIYYSNWEYISIPISSLFLIFTMSYIKWLHKSK